MTTTTRRPAAPATPRTGSSRPFEGAGVLLRLAVRRDRLRLLVWLVALTALTAGSAVMFAGLYPTAEQRQTTAETMGTPAGLAMSGPAEYLADYNVGSMMGHQILGFTAVLVGVMSVLTVVRHTRAEEESGRAELVRASVVGRHAPMAAALAVAVVANLAVAALFAVGLGALGLVDVGWGGSVLYGAAHAAVGMAFAGVTALTAQVTGHTRGASGLAMAAIGVAYVLRGVGDAGPGWVSWASPIGWAQATFVYVDDRWWPLALVVALAAAFIAVAATLNARRDVGAGLRQVRPGPAAASAGLATSVGLALRLQRGLLAGFAVALVVVGVSYGSILGEVEEMLGAVEGIEEVLAEVGGATVTESFLSMIMVVMAIITSVYGVLGALRPRAEEHAGRAEPLLATALSRARWVAGHAVVAMAGSALVLVLAALSVGVTGWLVLGEAALIGDLAGAALAYVPALWVTIGAAVALYGLLPRVALLVWLVPVYAFLAGYLGQILQFPNWTNNLSPFGNVPQLPAEELTLAPIAGLVVVAAALIAAGLAGLRRRDLSVG